MCYVTLKWFRTSPVLYLTFSIQNTGNSFFSFFLLSDQSVLKMVEDISLKYLLCSWLQRHTSLRLITAALIMTWTDVWGDNIKVNRLFLTRKGVIELLGRYNVWRQRKLQCVGGQENPLVQKHFTFVLSTHLCGNVILSW